MKISLVFPNLEMKDDAQAFKQEFYAAGERTINGGYKFDVDRYTYEEWIQILAANLSTETADPRFGTSETYFAVNEDSVIVGIVSFRHELTEFYANAGHVGYSVRPSMRRNGYATQILSEILKKARERGFNELKIVARQDNVPSIRTILNNGGTITRTFHNNDTEHSEYSINL